jgi:hypothetical protein
MPDIDWEPWFQFNRPWTTVIEQASVDQQRTSALQQWNHFIQTNAGKPAFNGVTRGMPFQVVDSNKGSTAVWQDQIPVKWNWFRPTFPTINTPLPTIVQRQGDPGGFATDDTHWIGLEPGHHEPSVESRLSSWCYEDDHGCKMAKRRVSAAYGNLCSAANRF